MMHRLVAEGGFSSTLTDFQDQLNLSSALPSSLTPFIQISESLILSLKHPVFCMDPPSPTGLHLKALFIILQPAEISVSRDRDEKQLLCLIQSLNQTVPYLRFSQENPETCKPERATSSPQAIPLKSQTKQNCIVIILDSSVPANLPI